MRRLRRAAGAAFAVALLGVVLGGCGAIDAIVKTETALEREGFRDATVSYYVQNDTEIVTVEWTARSETTEGLQEESRAAAGVVWRVAPVYFDSVETIPDAPAVGDSFENTGVFTRAQLEAQHGPRAEGLDQDAAELLNLRGLVLGSIGGVLVGSAVIGLIVWLVVRSGRKNRAAPVGAYPPPYPPPYPAPYPGQWSPPPPAPWGQPPAYGAPSDPSNPYQPPPR